MENAVVRAELLRPDGLATHLKAIRLAAALSGRQLSASLGWVQNKVSKIETGQQVPTVDDVTGWAKRCDAEDALGDLLAAQQRIRTTHLSWRDRPLTEAQAIYTKLHEESAITVMVEPSIVPGVLQTAAYARAMLRWVNPHQSDTDLTAAVAGRMARGRLLYEPGKQYRFIIGEPALLWPVLGPAGMRTQLDRLVSVIGVEGVELGVVGLRGQVGRPPAQSFAIHDGDVFVETGLPEDDPHPEGSAPARLFTAIADELWSRSVTGDEARALIVAAAASHR